MCSLISSTNYPNAPGRSASQTKYVTGVANKIRDRHTICVDTLDDSKAQRPLGLKNEARVA